MARTDSTLNSTAALSTSKPSPKNLDKSHLIVQQESPLDTLPFISDALKFVSTCLQNQPELSHFERTEIGAGIVLEMLALAIDDVQDALELKEKARREKG